MRIAINGRSILSRQRTGIGRYTYHLLDSLGKIDQVNSYILHAPKRIFDFKRRLPDFSRYKNFKNYVDCFGQGTKEIDIYHYPSPDKLEPQQGRLLVTIHDLIYKTYPQGHTPQAIEQTERYMQDIALKADGFICVSENTRQDLHAHFDIPQERTRVIYHGVDPHQFYPLSIEDRPKSLLKLKDLGIHQPYILFVGTIEPRKNLHGLLESFAAIKSKKIFRGQLVVAGMKGWMVENIDPLIKSLGIEKDVLFTSFVSDDQLRELYNLAEIFVFPSFYEGFGFPILEAFSSGAAVITSKTSSCGEIAGQAALSIDPQDTAMMAEKMDHILHYPGLKESLIQAGLKRAREFSFQRMAQQTLTAYQEVTRA